MAPGSDKSKSPDLSKLEALTDTRSTPAACLTGTLVCHAAASGIKIDSVESSSTGDLDVRGLFGLSEDVRKSFNKVTVNMRVKSEATPEELTELTLYSPVYDIVSRSLPVEFRLVTY